MCTFLIRKCGMDPGFLGISCCCIKLCTIGSRKMFLSHLHQCRSVSTCKSKKMCRFGVIFPSAKHQEKELVLADLIRNESLSSKVNPVNNIVRLFVLCSEPTKFDR